MKNTESKARPLALAGLALAVVAMMAVALALLGRDAGIRYTGSTGNPSGSGTVSIIAAANRPNARPLLFSSSAGKPLSLADFRGRTVLVNLWATWCQPCISEMPSLDALQGALGGDGFQVVTVSLDHGGAAAAEAWFRKHGIRHLTVYTADPAKFPDAMLPTSMLIDAKGRLAWTGMGARAWDSAALAAEIRALVEEKEAK